MNNDEPHPNSTGGILSSQERICEECKRKFVIPRMDLWVYKISVKGRTHWYCRWNCVRAAERKLEAKKVGRKNELKSKKPSKEKLEEHLRAGALIADIARKYGSSVQSVHNWIRTYGLKGLKDASKPSITDALPETTPIAGRSRKPGTSSVGVAMSGPVLPPIAQDSPSLSEIEQFHTDVKPQELPKVGIGPITPIATMMAEQIMSEVTEPQPSEPQTTEPLAITMEAEASDPNPAPLETIEEILRGACSKLVTLERLHVAETEKLFRKKLRALFASLVNELDGKY